MSVDALSPFRRGGERAARRPYDPPDRPAARRRRRRTRDARRHRGAGGELARGRWWRPIRGGLAGELQAIGGLFVRFPAATKNPLAMSLNMRRLQRIIASERVDLVHVRSRWAAWTAVKACRKAKRPLVTSLPADGGRTRPRI